MKIQTLNLWYNAGGWGWGRRFLGDGKFLLKRDKGGFAKILTDEGGEGGCKFFSPLIKKGSIIFGFFEIKKRLFQLLYARKKFPSLLYK